MQKVKLRRVELIDTLKANRETHRTEFLKALDGYKLALEKELRDRLDRLRNGVLVERVIRLPEPEDHTKDYDRVIKMAEMSVGNELELSAQEFAKFVMDDWEWKGAFTATSTYYQQEQS